MKTCSVCGVEKNESEYYAQKDCKSGLRTYCKTCFAADTNARKLADPLKFAEIQRRAQEKYKAKHPVRSDQSYLKSHLKIIFGLSMEEYEKLVLSQSGKCAICELESISKRLAVDHCHSSGLVRGLLCNNCNTGLGMFRDRPELLEKALKYLKGAS